MNWCRHLACASLAHELLAAQVSHLTTQLDEANEVHAGECRDYEGQIEKLSQEMLELQNRAKLSESETGGSNSAALLEQEVEARGERIAALEVGSRDRDANTTAVQDLVVLVVYNPTGSVGSATDRVMPRWINAKGGVIRSGHQHHDVGLE